MVTQVAAQQIENWPIERLVEYPRNPRKNDKAVDRMCASIREFGFKIPVLARSDGEVVDGHLRLKAARKLGITEIPVILCEEWTPAQVKAFRLMVTRSPTHLILSESSALTNPRSRRSSQHKTKAGVLSCDNRHPAAIQTVMSPESSSDGRLCFPTCRLMRQGSYRRNLLRHSEKIANILGSLQAFQRRRSRKVKNFHRNQHPGL